MARRAARPCRRSQGRSVTAGPPALPNRRYQVSATASLGGRGLTLLCLDVDRDERVVADEHAAVVERLVPDHAEILAVERQSRLETGDLPAPRRLREAEEVHGHGDLLLRATQVEGPRHFVAVLAELLDLRALERHRPVLLAVEEVGRLQVLVAPL